jgi:RNA polymerase sigma factor (sigma-70 family)
MKYKNLSNSKLIKLLAENPYNEAAWREFYNRFHKYICFKIYKVSRGMNYDNGAVEVEDLAHEVYEKLIKNNCQALKDFKGRHENAIYKYLDIIVIRLIINKRKEKGTPPQRIIPLLGYTERNEGAVRYIDIIPGDSIYFVYEHEEEIKLCLKKIIDSKKRDRNLLILNCYIFEGLKPKEIATLPGIQVEHKTVSNLLSKYMPALQKCLEEKGITV